MVLFSHISATTKKSEDDKAKKQHELYFKFEAGKRISISKPTAASNQRKSNPVHTQNHLQPISSSKKRSADTMMQEVVENKASSSTRVPKTSIERLEEAQRLWKVKRLRTLPKPETFVAKNSTQEAMNMLVDVVSSTLDSDEDCATSAPPLPSALQIVTKSKGLSSLPQVLISPPPTSTILRDEGTGTFMSKTLQRITTFPELIKRYMPKSETRAAGRVERGYWRIDTASWSEKRQVEFWAFLNHLIKNGRAGFGTMCVCGISEDGSQSHRNDALRIVRIYCWGEIHKAVWMMCALGTKGSSWLRGAKWISARDGKEIIVMN
jgi:hypothetical protein